MKFRRSFRFHSLKRVRIRQTWNKYNLFNLQVQPPRPRPIIRSFFQQKWEAKALMRGYHGEHIKERKWERMFSRRLASVVNMDPAYMAKFDGSEQAAGRGRGLALPPTKPGEGGHFYGDGRPDDNGRPWDASEVTNVPTKARTPYMQMTFAPMERRLDIAMFRAMFASSARQARQFVVHGAVTVNGKKMIYPGYLLNPGDMFQVDVERVLYGTGAYWRPTKKQMERRQAYLETRDIDAPASKAAQAAAPAAAKPEPAKADIKAAMEAIGRDFDKLTLADAPPQSKTTRSKEAAAVVSLAKFIKKFANLQQYKPEHAKSMGRLVRRMEDFVNMALKKLAREKSAESDAPLLPQSPTTAQTQLPMSEVVAHIGDLVARVPRRASLQAAAQTATKSETDTETETATETKTEAESDSPEADKTRAANRAKALLSGDEQKVFLQYFRKDTKNPFDSSKPYLTPWQPRPYMQAFADIPRYLEVNQKICAAVYLRHPVARPGMSEVPSPYPQELAQLAFNWYLRRR